MKKETKLTDDQKDLLLSIASNQFIFLRSISNEILKRLTNGGDEKNIKEMTRFIYLLSDSIHNIPNTIKTNNLVDSKTDLKIYIKLINEIERLDSDFKFKQRSGIRQYEKNRNKVIELFKDLL